MINNIISKLVNYIRKHLRFHFTLPQQRRDVDVNALNGVQIHKLKHVSFIEWHTSRLIIGYKTFNLIKHSTITAKIQCKFNVPEDDENPKILVGVPILQTTTKTALRSMFLLPTLQNLSSTYRVWLVSRYKLYWML